MTMRAAGRCALIALFCLLWATITPVAAAGAYADPQGRFSFAVPDGFQQGTLSSESKFSILFEDRSATGVRAEFAVEFAALDFAPTLDDISDVVRANAAKNKREFVSEQLLTFGGQPSRRFDYLETSDAGDRLRTLDIVTVRDNRFYHLVFIATPTGFPRYSAAITTLTTSFSLSATPTAPTQPQTPAATTTPPVSAPPSAPPTAPTGEPKGNPRD